MAAYSGSPLHGEHVLVPQVTLFTQISLIMLSVISEPIIHYSFVIAQSANKKGEPSGSP
jgi:hypothetical protein